MKYIQVFTTTSSKQEAQKIIDSVLSKRLAGCVQIHSVISKYWWKEKMETSDEWVCIFKTKEELYEDLENAIKEIHSYQNPEIIATPIIKGSKEYFTWLDEETEND